MCVSEIPPHARNSSSVIEPMPTASRSGCWEMNRMRSDVVQEALIKAFSGIEEFDGRSGFRFWFLRIVGNTALDWGRRRERRPTVTFGDERNPFIEPTCNDDPARGLYRQDLRRALDAGLKQLSPKIRSTFVLFAELELSYKEISEVQKIPMGTVMSRINAAREKLQQVLNWDSLKEID